MKSFLENFCHLTRAVNLPQFDRRRPIQALTAQKVPHERERAR
jgi:hypothetical protein